MCDHKNLVLQTNTVQIRKAIGLKSLRLSYIETI